MTVFIATESAAVAPIQSHLGIFCYAELAVLSTAELWARAFLAPSVHDWPN
jgi:hypothetical protein